MAITLPGYEAVFDNTVYTQEMTLPVGDEVIRVSDIIVPSRYVEPSEDDVVGYLRRKTHELDGFKGIVLVDGRRATSGERSVLEKAIMGLPDNVKRDIKVGKEDCLSFIRRNTPARALNEGEAPRSYVNIKYGILPSTFLERNTEAGNINDFSWYFGALGHERIREAGFGLRFNINILLNEGGKLSEKDEMDVLLRHGVVTSRTLDVNRPYELEKMQEIVDAIYAGLQTPDDIEQLRNVSDDILEELSLRPVIGLHEVVKEGIEQDRAETKFMKNIPRDRFFPGSNGSPHS